MSAGSPGLARDAVFVSAYVSWDAMRRRGGNFAQDRFTMHLLGSDLDHVLLAEPYRSVLSPLADVARRRARATFPEAPGRHRFRPLRGRREDPVDIDAVAKAYAGYDARLRKATRRRALRDPAVITTHPLVAGLAPLEWASRVTFYCTDDWTAYPARRPWWPAYEESFRRFAASGRRLCAVSAPLVEKLAPSGEAIVVPNGIEPSEWSRMPPEPAGLVALAHPRLAYVGTLDTRIDVPALAALAEALPHASLVLVGPVTEPEALEPLRDRANVHILPPVRRAGVTGILGAVDVGLIPHRDTPLTRCMSPLKLYEYLAAGLPVVATDLAPMRDVHPRVRLVPPGAALAQGARDALEAGPLTEVERTRFLAANSWTARQQRVLQFALS